MMSIALKQSPYRAKKWIPPRLGRAKEYGIAVCATILAFVLRLSLDSYLGNQLAYAAFLVAVAVTTWYGGIGPSLVAFILGGLIANLIFVQPRNAFSILDLEDQAGIAVYITVSFALVGFAQTWRWAWRRTDEMASELQVELDSHRRAEDALPHIGSMERTSASQHEHRL